MSADNSWAAIRIHGMVHDVSDCTAAVSSRHEYAQMLAVVSSTLEYKLHLTEKSEEAFRD